jgi:hypothetical protein
MIFVYEHLYGTDELNVAQFETLDDLWELVGLFPNAIYFEAELVVA